MSTPEMLDEVARYYSERLQTHGQTPQGVDWNGKEGQALRFEQILKVVDFSAPFAINDLGCGYGALLDSLTEKGGVFEYIGYDVSEDMVHAACQTHADKAHVQFKCTAEMSRADYTVASGIFNVKLNQSVDAWAQYVQQTLHAMDAASTKGFSFNCLTAYSDAERMRSHLYYPDPGEWFAYCKTHFSRNVALLHDYDLYEFTVLVRKK